MLELSRAGLRKLQQAGAFLLHWTIHGPHFGAEGQMKADLLKANGYDEAWKEAQGTFRQASRRSLPVPKAGEVVLDRIGLYPWHWSDVNAFSRRVHLLNLISK